MLKFFATIALLLVFVIAKSQEVSSRTNFKVILPAVTAIAATSFLFDNVTNSLAQNNQTDFLRGLSNATDIGGEKTIIVPVLLATYASSRFLIKDDVLRTTSWNAIKTVAVTAIATESIKNIAGRARPFVNDGAAMYKPFPGSKDQYKSMPSGHTSLAFAVFTPYAEQYSRWLYVIPSAVAFGRVYQNKHWLSDVVIGGSIGFVSGLLFTHHSNRIEIIPNGLVYWF